MSASIYVDGRDQKAAPKKAQPYVMPLRQTSAINVHLMFQQQQQQQLQQQQHQFGGPPPRMVSASTYVRPPGPASGYGAPPHAGMVTLGGPLTTAIPAHVAHTIPVVPVPTRPLYGEAQTQTLSNGTTVSVNGSHVHEAAAQGPAVGVVTVSSGSMGDGVGCQTDDGDIQWNDTGSLLGGMGGTMVAGNTQLVTVAMEPQPRAVTPDLPPPPPAPPMAEDTVDRRSIQSQGSSTTGETTTPDTTIPDLSALTIIPDPVPSPQAEMASPPLGSPRSVYSGGSGAGQGPAQESPPPSYPSLQHNDRGFSLQRIMSFLRSRKDDDEWSDLSWDANNSDDSGSVLDDLLLHDEGSMIQDGSDGPAFTRVGLLREADMSVIMKMKCSTDQMGYDKAFIALAQELIERCTHLGRRMKGGVARLKPQHLNRMRLADGLSGRDRVEAVASQLGGEIILCEAICQKHAERIHLAADVRELVYSHGHFLLGKLGTMTTLWKKHKYAVAKELSEPLCDHILTYKPSFLGQISEEQLQERIRQRKHQHKKSKKNAYDTVRLGDQPKDLLHQTFKGDYTISVAEAARRSFVDIIYFVMYE